MFYEETIFITSERTINSHLTRESRVQNKGDQEGSYPPKSMRPMQSYNM